MDSGRTVSHRASALPLRGLRLEVLDGPDTGLVHRALGDTIAVGTAAGNDVILRDDTVSRHHAEFSRARDRIVVEDCGSTNGVGLEGAYLQRAELASGTVLTLGRTRIRVSDDVTVEMALHDDDRLCAVRGRSPQMRAVMAKLDKAAQTDVSVLLLGETGTGKEVMAAALHEAGPRAKGPFEVVDCGALMPSIIASELFGHERGAFTGADRAHVGAFERAHGGTLFLDEIGELPEQLQVGLLGALERRSFRRVGGTSPVSVNVRVVCATNRDLRAEVNAGRFREDLYYRIAVMLLRIPPLRERSGDIPLLVEHFLREAGFAGRVDEVVPEAVMRTLERHHWPGNVRELRNFAEVALAMGEAPDFQPMQRGAPQTDGTLQTYFESLAAHPYSQARTTLLNEFEAAYLRVLMETTQHNVSAAARAAKMNRSYLTEMLKRHGIR